MNCQRGCSWEEILFQRVMLGQDCDNELWDVEWHSELSGRGTIGNPTFISGPHSSFPPQARSSRGATGSDLLFPRDQIPDPRRDISGEEVLREEDCCHIVEREEVLREATSSSARRCCDSYARVPIVRTSANRLLIMSDRRALYER